MSHPKFSIISPVYGAASLLEELVSKIKETILLITNDFEIILVEDHSPDNSWEILEQLATTDHVKAVSLSRNFGQQAAIGAGLELATGEWIVVMDCDLQDTPAEIIKLYNEAQKGYDIVLAARTDRKDDIIKKVASKLFYRTLQYLTEVDIDSRVANFVLYHRKVVDAYKQMPEYFMYYPFVVHWVGFKKTIVEINHAKRKDDKRSSYTYKKRLKLAFNTIISFSDKPLRLLLRLGVIMVIFSVIFAFALAIRYLFQDITVPGWTSTFISLWFIGGVIVTMLGLVGIYVGKTFENVKRRPRYLIREILQKNEA